MREDGRERESERDGQEQGPRESKDETRREEVRRRRAGGRGRTLWIRGEKRVYAGGMGALRARVQYLAR